MGIGDWAQSPIPILSNNFLKKIKNIKKSELINIFSKIYKQTINKIKIK